ncbi:MAG: hypothetical protein IPK33_03045 [Gemmatimonadetes bacterium]|nr:hypothetical protein [Gemmatimonadota bacterium]
MSTSSGTLSGAELWYGDDDGSAVMLRYQSGTLRGAPTALSSGKVAYLDSRVMLGNHAFALVGGYTMRTMRYEGTDRRFHLPRAGLRAGYRFAGSGVTLRAAGSYVRTTAKAKADSVEADGLDGETAVLYIPPRLPLYVELGYRRELFNLRREGEVFRREEMGGVLLSVGLQYGLSTR